MTAVGQLMIFMCMPLQGFVDQGFAICTALLDEHAVGQVFLQNSRGATFVLPIGRLIQPLHLDLVVARVVLRSLFESDRASPFAPFRLSTGHISCPRAPRWGASPSDVMPSWGSSRRLIADGILPPACGFEKQVDCRALTRFAVLSPTAPAAEMHCVSISRYLPLRSSSLASLRTTGVVRCICSLSRSSNHPSNPTTVR